MTTPLPRISVVTSSYNQGQFIDATIRSVMAQDYPNIEHIVVDGMSTDSTVDVLGQYPHLHVVRERDNGQADAINKGFRIASGDIFCFLNSDDTLEPGALHRVAQELDPARGRHVAMGRCRFIDESGNFIGVEHPSAFENHRRVLEIWRGHNLPQPATFWTREVWERCGPLDETAYWLDYDLFCRFSRDYVFHFIDQVLANYRLHGESKTASTSERERLEASIAVSRRYWGGLSFQDRLGLAVSYMRFRVDRRRRARTMLSQAKASWRTSSPLPASYYATVGSMLAPDLIWDVVVMPRLKPLLRKMVSRSRALPGIRRRTEHPQTLAWRGFESLHSDGWAGPTLIQTVQVEAQHTSLALVGSVPLGGFRWPLVIEASIDGGSLGQQPVADGSQFVIEFPLRGVRAGSHQVRIVSNQHAVPHDLFGNQDYRPLSFRLEQLRLE
jgi:glycosyltransferase involved in cell wall biosynthesis